MSNAEKIERVYAINKEIVKLEQEKARLEFEIERSHGIVIVGGHDVRDAHRMIGILNRLACERPPTKARILIHALTPSHLARSFADVVLKESFKTADVKSISDFLKKIATVNEEEARRQHELLAKHSSKVRIRKRARGYF